MEITKIWIPYNYSIHANIKSRVQLDKNLKYVILMKIRNEQGEMLHEHQLNYGEPLIGKPTVLLDYDSIFKNFIRKHPIGCFETHFVHSGDKPYCGEICTHYSNANNFSCFRTQLLKSFFNNPAKPGKYRGYSPHYIDENVEKSGLVIMNASHDPNYSRTGNFNYEVKDSLGNVLQNGAIKVAPFGTAWIDIDKTLLKNKTKMYTFFGKCDGCSFISMLYTKLKNGSLGIDHTQPSSSQISYGENIDPSIRNRWRKVREKYNKKLNYIFNKFE